MPPGGIPSCPMAVHPVCPDCPSLGNARRDLAELHLEDSSSWRCPPGCQHCFNMGRPTHLIPRTPSVIGPPMRTPLVPDVRPSPASCKVLNQKFTKHRSWSKWQRDYERQGGTWPYSSSKWQDLSLGGWEILCASSWWKKISFHMSQQYILNRHVFLFHVMCLHALSWHESLTIFHEWPVMQISNESF